MAWDWSSLPRASNYPTKGIHLSSRDASGAKGSFSAVPFPRQRHRASSTKPPRKGQYRLSNCVLNLRSSRLETGLVQQAARFGSEGPQRSSANFREVVGESLRKFERAEFLDHDALLVTERLRPTAERLAGSAG